MSIDLGLARAVDAQSFGQPGERTFRLRVVGAQGETASLWMEKQQFQALSLAIQQMLAQLDYRQEPATPVEAFPQYPQHDLRVGRMSMGYDHAPRNIVLYAHALGEEESEPAALGFRLTPEQCAVLDAQLRQIIDKGRPVCPLCGASIDASGHMCIRANGHSTQPLPEERNDEELA